MKIVAVKRKECFSPNSVEKDTAILRAVADKMAQQGEEVTILPEEKIEEWIRPDSRAENLLPYALTDMIFEKYT